MEPSVEQLKTYYHISSVMTELGLPIQLVILNEATKRLNIVAAGVLAIEILLSGEFEVENNLFRCEMYRTAVANGSDIQGCMEKFEAQKPVFPERYPVEKAKEVMQRLVSVTY